MHRVIVCFALLAGVTTGLKCFTCDNARSMFMCAFQGRIRTCEANQNSCETVVRRSNARVRIIKRCKQTQACLENAKRQLTPSKIGYAECNTDRWYAACTCCCETELCNLNNDPCTGMTFPCAPRGPIVRGAVSCSDGNRPGSVCNYECPGRGLFLRPSQNAQATCSRTGEWSRSQPCCARACPPYFPNDIVFVRQASTEEAWEEFKNRIVTIVGRFHMRNESARVGVISFGENIHSDTIITFSEFANNKTGFLRKIVDLPYTQDNTSRARGGNALEYLLEDFFAPAAGDREGVKNVIVFQADSASQDDVSGPADRLRREGHKIFVIESVMASPELQGQMRSIARDLENIFVEETPTDTGYVQDLIRAFCSDPCAN